MYHSILKEKARSGKYIVTPDILEQDLEYISSKGYTSITMTDLINYVYNNEPLPEKAIIITFDDGYYNNFGYAIPILKKYNMKGVISIVGEYTDMYSKSGEANLNYGYMRWEDIQDAIKDGTIEFQNHSYSLLGFKASLSCFSGINFITKDKNCLYLLKRNNRPNNVSTEEFFKKLLINN